MPPAPKPAAKPVAAKVPEPASSPMTFAQQPVAPPKPSLPSPAKPAAATPVAPPKPAAATLVAPPKPAAPPAVPAEEGAGRTMMFQTGNLRPSTPAAGKPAPKPVAESPHATMVFGQSPVAPAKSAMPSARPAAKPAEPAGGSTMLFGQSPLAKAPPAKAAPFQKPVAQDAAAAGMMSGASPALAKPGASAKPAPAPAPAREPMHPPRLEAAGQEEPSAGEAAAEPAPEEEAASGVEAEGAEERSGTSAPRGKSAFDKAPPKGLLIGVAAGLAALLVAGGALVAAKKLGKHAPPPAAVEALSAAQADADKDTLSSLSTAESKAKDALEVAGPKAYFPQATAALAVIEIQWADALNDQATFVSAKGAEGSEAKAAELQAQAKAKLKAAFDALSPAIKADHEESFLFRLLRPGPKSPDLQLALADYYRAQHSGSMNKALKVAQALKADDAKVSLVQGMALAQDDEGAERAIPKLKAALAGNPQSARLHFRLALAYQAMKDDANATAELKETLRLSPQHERAKLFRELSTASADGK